MKRRLLAGALALMILTGGAVLAFAGSQSEILVSLSYLGGTFWEDLKAIARVDVDRNTTAFYNEALARARETGGASAGFSLRAGKNGDVLSGTVGSGLIWTAGSGVVQGGTLVDVTVGSEVAAGGALTVGHRYLAGTDVTLSAASDDAQWMAEGTWTVSPGDPVRPPELPFTDVRPGEWYYDDVAFVYGRGLFNGDSPTTFQPGGRMQRCMMTTVLHRLAGEPPVGYSDLFRDVPDGQWFTAGTIWAGRLKVVTGVGDGEFAPYANVTRQEIAVILYRYGQQLGRDMSASAGLSEFSDAASVAAWGQEAISWAVGAGIINGSDGALLPNGYATRAEVAAMLHRFVNWAQG